MKITVATTLHCCPVSTVELPKGVSWKNIKEWWVKWDTLYLITKSGKEYEIELGNDDLLDAIDSKRPILTQIRDEKGDLLEEDEG